MLCLTMATSVLSASFAVFLVRERECASKGVQMVAGAPPTAFWGAAYAWDLLNFSIPALGEGILIFAQLLSQVQIAISTAEIKDGGGWGAAPGLLGGPTCARGSLNFFISELGRRHLNSERLTVAPFAGTFRHVNG